MKRASFSLLAATLAFVFACQPSQNGGNANGTGNANANRGPNTSQTLAPAMASTDKIVQIFIHDDPAKPGYYEIEDPGSITLHKRKNQKIAWCVVYDGSTVPSDVVIDGFRFPPPPASPTATNPFGDGSSGDNTFEIAAADFGSCRKGTKTPKVDVDLRAYKYKITVKVNGSVRGTLDPEVVISE